MGNSKIQVTHWLDIDKDKAACGHGWSLYDGRYPTSTDIEKVNCNRCRAVSKNRATSKTPEFKRRSKDRFSGPVVNKSDYTVYVPFLFLLHSNFWFV